jgi:DNA-binding transcriptional MocR family regulator
MPTGAKTPALEAILHALGQHPNTTAAELADHAKIGRSTANKVLASLATDGRVTRQPGGRVAGRIIPDRWTLVADAPAKAAKSPANEATVEPPAGVAPHDGEDDGQTSKGSTTTAMHVAEPTDAVTKTAQGTDDQPSTPRLGNGALRDLVREYLAERPGQEFTPHQIAKALGGRSAGAVSNALTSKAVQHDIIQTSTQPRRYMIAPQPNDSAGSAEAH